VIVVTEDDGGVCGECECVDGEAVFSRTIGCGKREMGVFECVALGFKGVYE
jgi:hypothetical protein